MTLLDGDAITACADLVARTGAKEFKIGYLHDNVPPEQAAWYAHAQYRGARIGVENHRGPTEAADALSQRLLTGAQCFHCKKLVALSDHGAMAFDTTLVDGTPWTKEQAAKAGQCRWRRMAARWVRGCDADGLAASIEHALETGDVDSVPGLLMQLAVEDPRRAKELLDTIEVGISISRQMKRQIRRQDQRSASTDDPGP